MDNKRLVRITLISLLALGCVLILQPFLPAILFAAVVCTATWPLYMWIMTRLGGRAVLASSLMILLLMLLVFLPMVFLTASLTDVVPTLLAKLGRLFAQAQVTPPEWLRSIPLIGPQLDSYWQLLVSSSEELSRLLRQLYEPTRVLLVYSGALAGEGLLQLVLTVFIAFFLYRDGATLATRLRLAGHQIAGELGDQILMLTRNTIMGVMIGIIGTAAGQSIIALVGFLIAGVPGAMLLATATFFLSMIPVGPPLIWGGAAFWLYDNGETGWAVFMIVWGLLAISSVDNLLKPMLISRSSSLPILPIVLGVFGGIFAFGFVGIFLGPTLLAVAIVLGGKWTSGEIAAARPPKD